MAIPERFSLLFLLLCSTAVWSQNGKLTGTITLDQTLPGIGVSVLLEETSKFAVSDMNGNFVFTNLTPGEYTLKTSTVEAEPTTVRCTVKSGENHIRISLNSKPATLEEVLVESKTATKKLNEKGYAVSVIETQKAQLQSVQTNELLDRSAGIRIRQTGGLGSNVEYNINGLSGNSIRILVDGIPVRNYGPSFSLNSIPPSLIERIEVYKGVLPPNLADDALGGAINIVLKKSIHNNLSASYSYGSFNTHQANVNGGYRNDKTGFTVNGSAFYNYTDNDYEVWGDKVYTTNPNNGTIIRGNRYKRFHDAYRSYGGKLDVGYTDVKWADQFSIGALFSDMFNEIQHGSTMEIVYGNRHATQSTQMLNLAYNKRDFLTRGLDVNVLSTYSFLRRNVVDTIADIYTWSGNVIGTWAAGGEQGRATLEESDEYNFSLRANTSYQINENNLIGLNFAHNNFRREQDDPYMPAAERVFQNDRNLSKNLISVSYENKAFNQRLRTTLFYKYYEQTVETTSITRSGPGGGGAVNVNYIDNTSRDNGYGIALSYALRPDVLIVASGERAIRFPGSTEVFGNNADNILANPMLKPEQSLNANLGVNLGHFDLFSDRHQIGFNFNVFLRDTKDMIRQGVPSAVSETFAFENLNAVISKGFDAELAYNYNRKVFLTANASLFDSKFNTRRDANGNPFFYYGSRLRNVPYFTSNVNVRYNMTDFVQKGALMSWHYNLGFVNEFLRDWEGIGGANLDYVPEQLVHDFGFTYTLPNRRVSLSFDVKNILDRQVFDNWALQKPGRAFYGKINYSIL